MPRPTTDRRRHGPLLIVLAVALLLVPAAAWAGHQFADVPSSATFHDDIAWMRDNGVTRGCNPPDNTRYCPSENVTREQMAAFLHRLETEDVFLTGEDIDGAFLTSDDVDGLLPIATFLFFPDGTVASQDHRSPVTGDVSVADNGTGSYRVTLPGFSYGLASSRAVCTFVGSGANTVSVASLSGDMWIRVYDSSGAAAEPVNSGVSCAVYG